MGMIKVIVELRNKSKLLVKVLAFSAIYTANCMAGGSYPTDSFDIPEGAYSATFVEARNHVTVMSFSGNFDDTLETGAFNRGARATVAKEFYRTHQDNYDFIVTFTSFEYATPEARAFYHGVKNDVQGIGLPLFDNSAVYGSNGKLQGMIDMAALSRSSYNPFQADYEYTLSTLAHEVLHRWSSFVNVDTSGGLNADVLRGKDDAHWSFYLDTDASVEYGHQWRDNGDGTFTATAAKRFYSPLDLYLMGFYGPEEIEDFFVIEPTNSEYSKDSYPVQGAKVSGTKHLVSINDVIAAEGARIPAKDQAQKEFRIAFVYLIGESEIAENADIVKIDNFRRAFMDRFAILTGGRAIAHVYPQALPEVTAGEQSVVEAAVGDTVRVDSADVQDALEWLKTQQNSGLGYWEDKPATRFRDTAVVLDALQSLDASFTNDSSAYQWLEDQQVENTDSLARKIRLNPTNKTALVEALVARQNVDGGWGLLAGFESNVLDTSLAVQALSSVGDMAALAFAQMYLIAEQNADFGWEEIAGGNSNLRATLAAITALQHIGAFPTPITNATYWVASQQNIDGGFGAPASTVNETAETLVSLVQSRQADKVDQNAALAYLNNLQRESGAWEGSVYTTALAANALRSITLQNLAVVEFYADAASKRDGERVHLTVAVTNNSPLNTALATLALFDGDPKSGASPIVSSAVIPVLAPGEIRYIRFVWDTLNSAGSKTLYAVVDPEAALVERSLLDNVATLAYEVAEAPENVDLEVTESEFVLFPAAPSLLPASLSASVVVRNLGLADATDVGIQLWQGEAQSGILLEEQPISVTSRLSTVANFVFDLTEAGTTHYTVVVNPTELPIEDNFSNNTSTQAVTTSSSIDLAVTQGDFAISSLPVYLYQDATFTINLRNQGTLASPNVGVKLFILGDNGYELLEDTQLTFAAGETKPVKFTWQANRLGDTALRVLIDEENLIAEADETNNVQEFNFSVVQLEGINVTLKAAELGFSQYPANESLGLVLSTTVYNTGTETVTSVPVGFYDGDPATGGVLIGDYEVVPEITAGSFVTVEHVWPQVMGTADHYVFAVVDPENAIAELDETDNQAFDTLQVNSVSDLVVTEGAIQLDPRYPSLGETATVTVSVSNLGEQAAENVLVRAFNGDPDNGGIEIGSGYPISDISGFGIKTVSFDFSFTQEGTQRFYVEVDPDGAITESNKLNNNALKTISVQDGSLYVSERYFSPNGDKVKDSTRFFFELDTPETVRVAVLDATGSAVRTFDEVFNNATTGNIEWDGRTDVGSLAYDGNYYFSIKHEDGSVSHQTKTVLDTNRASLVEALGTQHEVKNFLSCNIGAQHANAFVYGPKDEFVYYLNTKALDAYGKKTDESDEIVFPAGLYRANWDGSDARLVSNISVLDLESRRFFNNGVPRFLNLVVSDDGKRLAFILTSDYDFEFEVWSASTSPGSGLTLIESFNPNPADTGYGSSESIQFIKGTHRLLASYPTSVDNEQLEVGLSSWDVDTVGGDRVDHAISLAYARSANTHISINSLGSHVAIQFKEPVRSDGRTFGYSSKSYLYNIASGISQNLGGEATAISWAPDGTKLAVGDPAMGGVVVYNLDGEVIQSYRFPDQFDRSLASAAAPSIDTFPDWAHIDWKYFEDIETPKLVGNIEHISWNPDSSALLFSLKDVASSFLYQILASQYGTFDCDCWYAELDGGVEPEDFDLALFDYQGDMSGVYLYQLAGNKVEQITSQLPTANAISKLLESNQGGGMESFSFDEYDDSSGALIPVVMLEDFDQNILGVPVTREGLPVLADVKGLQWLNNSSSFWVKSDTYVAIDTAGVLPAKKITPLRAISSLGQSNKGEFLKFYAEDNVDACATGMTDGYRLVRSLLNLTSDLRITRNSSSGSITLHGTATDQNFDFYTLEYASVDSPDNWQQLQPAVNQHAIDEDLSAWVPASTGSFFVRLSSHDLAGNSRDAIKQVSTSVQSSISNLYRTPAYFSPNSDGVKDVVSIHFRVLTPINNFTVEVLNEEGAIVRTIVESYTEIGSEQSITWDGRNDSGDSVADGTYTLRVQNNELLVTLDTVFPTVLDLTGPWYQSILFDPFDARSPAYLEVSNSITIQAFDDVSVPDAEVTYRHWESADWLNTPINFIEQGARLAAASSLSIQQWVSGEYQAKASDQAGNTTVTPIDFDQKINQSAIIWYGQQSGDRFTNTDTVIGNAAINPNAAGFIVLGGKPYFSKAGLFPDLRVALNVNKPLVFRLNETIPGGISSVHVMYGEAEAAIDTYQAASSVSYGSIGACYTYLGQNSSDICFFEQNNLLAHHFGLSVDLPLLDLAPGTTYNFYVQITPDIGPEVKTNGISFTTSEKVILDNRVRTISGENIISGYLSPVANEEFQSATISIQNTEDDRYLEKTVYKTIFPEDGKHSLDLKNPFLHFSFGAESLMPCSTYQVTLDVKTKDGKRVSDSKPIDTQCLAIEVMASPVVADECNTGPTNMVRFEMVVEELLSYGDPVDLKTLELYTVGMDGTKSVHFNSNSPRYNQPLEYVFDTTLVESGAVIFYARAVDVNDNEAEYSLNIPITYEEPTLDIVYPIEGQTYCATAYLSDKPKDKEYRIAALEIQGQSISAGKHNLAIKNSLSLDSDLVSYAEFYNPGGAVECKKGSTFTRCKLNERVDKFGEKIITTPVIYNPLINESRTNGVLGYVVAEGSREQSIYFEQTNWSGALSCSNMAVTIDSRVEGLSIRTTGGVQRVTASGDGYQIFSPNGDGFYDELHWQYSVEEAVSLTLTIHDGATDELVASVYEGAAFAQGDHVVAWHAESIPDGLYVARFETQDGCGFVDRTARWVELDVTPPVVQIVSPTSNQSLGVIVEPLANIVDANSFSTQLSYGQNQSLMAIIDSKAAILSGSELSMGHWNTFGLTGSWLLGVNAVDIVGNHSSGSVEVALPERDAQISHLAATEKYVAPNGDEQFANATFTVTFENDVVISADIFKGDEIVEPLLADAVYTKGTHRISWDGLNNASVPFENGIYSIRVQAQAAHTVSTIQTESTSIILDAIAPQIQVDGLDSGLISVRTNLEAASLLGSVTDTYFNDYSVALLGTPNSASVFTTIAGGDVAPISLLANLSDYAVDEGEYKFQVSAKDVAGNRSSLTFDMLFDTSAPAITITSPVNDLFVNSSGSLVVKGSIEEANLLNYSASLVSSAGVKVLSQQYDVFPVDDTLTSINLTTLPEGQYTLQLSVVDKVGNTAEESKSVVIDNTPPEVVISSPKHSGYFGLSLIVTGTAEDSNFDKYLVELAAGGSESFETIAEVRSGIHDGALFNFDSLPADGDYSLQLTAVDKAGNTAAVSHDFIVDSIVPMSPSITVAEADKETAAVSLEWLPVEDTLTGYWVYRNGQKVVSEPISNTHYLDSSPGEGTHQYSISAIDTAGHESEKTSQNVTLDLTGPEVSFTYPQTGDTVSGLVNIRGTAYSASDFSHYRLLVGPSSELLTEVSSATVGVLGDDIGQWNTVTLSDGQSYVLRVEAEDINGNSAFDEVSVIIDNTAPTAPEIYYSVINFGNTAHFRWNAPVEDDIAGYLVLRNNKIANASGVVVGDLAPYLVTDLDFSDYSLPDGEYSFTVIAIDTAGNQSDPSAALELTIDLQTPHAELIGLPSFFDDTLFLNAQLEDLDVATMDFEYRQSGQTDWVLIQQDSLAPYQHQWDTSDLDDGLYELRAVAQDIHANIDGAADVVMLEKRDLTIPGIPSSVEVAVNGGTATLTWIAPTDLDIDFFEVQRRFQGEESWSVISSLPFGGTEYADEGLEDDKYEYNILTQDLSGNRSSASEVVGATVYTPYLRTSNVITSEPTELFAGRAQAYASITFNVMHNAISIGSYTTVANESGNFWVRDVVLEPGQNEYTIHSVDQYGFVGKTVTGYTEYSAAPSQVTGLLGSVNSDEENVSLSWNSNTESNIFGYGVYRNDVQITPAAIIEPVTHGTDATDLSAYPISNLFDGDDNSLWIPESMPSYLELEFDGPQYITGIGVRWNQYYYSSNDYVLQVWNGERYLPIKEIGYASSTQNLTVKYITNKVRFVFNDTYYGDGTTYPFRLSEISVSTLSFTDDVDYFTDLPGDGEHSYTVAAINDRGMEGPASEPTLVEVGDFIGPAPVSLSINVNGVNVELTWTESDSDDTASYRVYRDGQLIQELSSAELSYADEGLANGSYQYTIRGVDALGNAGDPSNIVAADILTPVLAAPVDLAALSDSEGGVRLSWKPGPDTSPGAYKIYRALGSEGLALLVEESNLSHYDVSVAEGITYRYTIRAEDAYGNLSAHSSEVSVLAEFSIPVNAPTIVVPSTIEPLLTGKTRVSVTGEADPGSRIFLVQNNTVVQEATTSVSLTQFQYTNFEVQRMGKAENGTIAVMGNNYDLKAKELLIGSNGQWVSSNYYSSNRPSFLAWLGSYVLYMDDYDGKFEVVDHESGTVVSSGTAFAAADIYSLLSTTEDSVVLIARDYDVSRTGLFTVNLTTLEKTFEPLDGFCSTCDLSMSPNGRHLAYVDNGTDLVVFDRDTKTIERITVGDTTLNEWVDNIVSWNADGDKAIFAAGNIAGYDDVVMYDFNKVEVTVLASDSEFNLSLPEWSDSADAFVYQARNSSNNTQIRITETASGDTTFAQELSYSGSLEFLDWSASTGISFGSDSSRSVSVLTLPGLFRFADVGIHIGENQFVAIAADETGNQSNPSESAYVIRTVPEMADLNIDFVNQERVLLAGNETEVTFIVSNIGGVLSAETSANISLVSESGIVLDLGQITVPRLEPGSNESLALSWQAGDIGNYRLVVNVDTENLVVESNDSNTSTVEGILVVDSEDPVISLNTEQSSIGANTDIAGNLSLVNTATTLQGELRLVIEDAEGYLVEELSNTPVDLAFGQRYQAGFVWNSATIFPGDYRVVATLYDSNGLEASSQTASFEISEDINLVASVVAALPSYTANEVVRMPVTVLNQGGNALYPGGSATISIYNSLGETLYSVSRNVGEILPGEAQTFEILWNSAVSLPGNYQVQVSLVSESIAELNAQASFTILASRPTLTGKITLSESAFGKDSSISVGYEVSNHGNAAVSDITLSLTLFDNSTGAELVTNSLVQSVEYTSKLSGAIPLDLTGIDLGDYAVRLSYEKAILGQTLSGVLDQSFASIVDTEAPEVTILEPEEGAIVSGLLGTLKVEAQDADSRIDSVYVRFGGGDQQQLPKNSSVVNQFVQGFDGLSEGEHELRVVAEDSAGNISGEQLRLVTIDNSLPMISVSGVLSGEYYSEPVIPVINVSDANLSHSAITLNGESFTSGTSIEEDGEYRMVVSAEDAAGNIGTDIILFTIDTTEAQIDIDGVSDQAAYNVPIAPVVTITDDNLVSSTILLNGNTYESGGAIVEEGGYILHISATDAAGTTVETSVEFELDFTAPMLPSVSAPTNGSSVSNSSVDIIGHSESNAFISMTLQDSTLLSTTADGAGIFSFTDVELNPGENSFAIVAQDRAGNASGSLAYALSFSVQGSTELSGVNVLSTDVLIWAAEKSTHHHPSCSSRSHSGHRTDFKHYDRDLEAQLEFFEQVYQAAGISYTVARSRLAFITALRSQKHNVVQILNTREEYSRRFGFDGRAILELKGAVASGTGLIVSNTQPHSFRSLASLTGVKLHGRVPGGATVNISDNFISGDYVWTLEDDLMRVRLAGGIALGSIEYSCYRYRRGNCSQPAFVANQFGEGQTVTIPFNLLDIPDSEAAQSLAISMVSFVEPSESESIPSTLQYVDWTIDSSESGSLFATQELRGGMEYFELSEGGMAESDTSAQWYLMDMLTFGGLILLPESAGDFTVETSIYAGEDNNGSLLATENSVLSLRHSLREMETELIAMLEELPSSGRHGRRTALALHAAKAAVVMDRNKHWQLETALLWMSLVIDDLERMGHEDELILAASILKAYQSQWVVHHNK